MNANRIIVLIMVGIAAWGVFHAVGAYQFNHNLARPLMVILCSEAFLAFWLVMLNTPRGRMLRDRAQNENQPQDQSHDANSR